MGPKCASTERDPRLLANKVTRSTAVPLRRKLARFSLLTAGLSGLLVCGLLLFYESHALKRDLAARLEDIADMGKATGAIALSRRDAQSAQALLEGLAIPDSVQAAAFYDSKGKLFSSYVRPHVLISMPAATPPQGTNESGGVLWVVRPVQTGGSICLVGDLSHLSSKVLLNLAGTVFALFICLGASMLVLLRFLRATVEPILGLTRMAQQVSATRAYDLRAKRGPDDEVGELVDAFNDMLREIETRDSELKAHRNNLEQLVEARTRELVAAKDKAEEAARLKGEFLANVSHEIRTPLNGVLGMTDLALETRLDATQKDYLDTIKTSAETLMAVINDVLDFSKIEAGRMDVESIAFSPHSVMAAAARTVAFKAKEKGIGLRWNASRDLPPMVTGDPLRLKQVLLNMLGNAVKFTSTGEVRLEASIDSGHLLFSIHDTGIGIPATKLTAIFEPFRQADGSSTRQFGGTGLGLSICSKLVGLMGGEIGVESEVGQGSRFWFTIPLRVAMREAEPAPRKPKVIPTHTATLHILLAEDNLVNQRVATRLLEKMGHRVSVASNGEEAVDLSLKEPVDVILMDVQMPVMSGFGRHRPDPRARERQRSPHPDHRPHRPRRKRRPRAMPKRRNGRLHHQARPVRSPSSRPKPRRRLAGSINPCGAGCQTCGGLPNPPTQKMFFTFNKESADSRLFSPIKMETISFAIGGVFMAVLALLLGSKLRNLAPGAAGEFVKPALIVIGILLACFGGRDWAMNTVYGWLGRNPSPVVVENARQKEKATVALPASVPPTHAGGARISAEFVPGPDWKTSVSPVAPTPTPEPDPLPAAEPTPTQPGRVKKSREVRRKVLSHRPQEARSEDDN